MEKDVTASAGAGIFQSGFHPFRIVEQVHEPLVGDAGGGFVEQCFGSRIDQDDLSRTVGNDDSLIGAHQNGFELVVFGVESGMAQAQLFRQLVEGACKQ